MAGARRELPESPERSLTSSDLNPDCVGSSSDEVRRESPGDNLHIMAVIMKPIGRH